mmetsp:Transcript_82791/g.221208  ORF Transcript_82791/g.221208 Transcript_82791/m.221208 type:complete len:201 (-) Transcript_82791:44-646(-)
MVPIVPKLTADSSFSPPCSFFATVDSLRPDPGVAMPSGSSPITTAASLPSTTVFSSANNELCPARFTSRGSLVGSRALSHHGGMVAREAKAQLFTMRCTAWAKRLSSMTVGCRMDSVEWHPQRYPSMTCFLKVLIKMDGVIPKSSCGASLLADFGGASESSSAFLNISVILVREIAGSIACTTTLNSESCNAPSLLSSNR